MRASSAGPIATWVISGASCTMIGMPTACVDGAEVLEDAVGVRFEEVRRQDHQRVGAFGLRLPAQRHGDIGSRCAPC